MMASKATFNAFLFLILFLIIPSLTIVLTSRDFAANYGTIPDPNNYQINNNQYRNEDANFERPLNPYLPTTNYGSTLNYANPNFNPVPYNPLAYNPLIAAAVYGSAPLPYNLNGNNYGQSYPTPNAEYGANVFSGAGPFEVQRPPLPIVSPSYGSIANNYNYNPMTSPLAPYDNVVGANYGQPLPLTPPYATTGLGYNNYPTPSYPQLNDYNFNHGQGSGTYGASDYNYSPPTPLPYAVNPVVAPNNYDNYQGSYAKELPLYVPSPCADLGSAANASFCCSGTNGRIDDSGINRCCLVTGSSCSSAPNMCCDGQACKAVGNPASGVHICADPNYISLG